MLIDFLSIETDQIIRKVVLSKNESGQKAIPPNIRERQYWNLLFSVLPRVF